MNNDFALSNKIFTYIQAGLVVIVTDTTAQLAFIKQHPAIGKLYKKGDYNTLAEILNYFYFNRDILTQIRQETLRLAQEKLNWETEQVKFLKLIEETV
jgi:glycosyltransferase involved in cell wall biosynthesis